MSQDSFRFYDGDSEEYIGLRTLLRSPENSIMPVIAKISGGIVIYGERLKTRLKTLFFNLFAEVDQNFCNRARNIPVLAGPLFIDLIKILQIQENLRNCVFE